MQQAGRVARMEHVPVGLQQRGHEERVEGVDGHVRRVGGRVLRPEVVRGPRNRGVLHPAHPSADWHDPTECANSSILNPVTGKFADANWVRLA